MGRQRTYSRHGLSMTYAIVRAEIRERKKNNEPDDEIINSGGGAMRQYLFPSDLGREFFTPLDGKGFEKQKGLTEDEVFARATIAKCMIRSALMGQRKSTIIRKASQMLITSYITADENQKIRKFQGRKSIELQTAFLAGGKIFQNILSAYLKEYKEEIINLRLINHHTG